MLSKFKQFNRNANLILDRYDRYVWNRWNTISKFRQFMVLNGLGLMIFSGFVINFVVGYILSALFLIQMRMYIQENKRHIAREL